MSRIKIAAVIANHTDQCSLYRGVMPLSYLDPDQFLVTYVHPDFSPGDWHLLAGYDILFYLRPGWKKDLDRITLAKEMGLKVVIDYDDDFLEVDQHVWMKRYAKEKQNVIACLKLADQVWVSTERLREIYSEFAPGKIDVIPNGYAVKHLPFQDVSNCTVRRTDSVSWRGSATHDEDLLSVAMEWIEVANQRKHVKNVFYWDLPKFIAYFVKHEHRMFPTVRYHHDLARLSPLAQICPLTDNRFNQCKSNAAWLEGIMAGAAPCIAPSALKEFQVPGVIGYNNSDGFRSAYLALTEMDEAERKMIVKQGQEYILDCLDLEKLTRLRENSLYGTKAKT